MLDDMLPEGYHDARRCGMCMDTGLVTVVSTLKKNRHGAWVHSTAVASCGCGEGDRVRRMENPPPAFDDMDHARIRPTASSAEACAAVDALLKRREEAKRVTAFDTFNERGV